MKRTVKQILSLVLTLAVVVSLLPTNVLADDKIHSSGGKLSLKSSSSSNGVWNLADSGITKYLKVSTESYVTETEQERNAAFKVNFTYALTEDIVKAIDDFEGNPVLVYDLNDVVNNSPLGGIRDKTNGSISIGSRKLGTYTIKDNVVTLTFTDTDYFNNKTSFTGFFDATLETSSSELGSQDEYTYHFPGTTNTIPIKYKKTVEDGTKSVYSTKDDDGNYTLHYTANINVNNDVDSLVFNDTISGLQTLDADSVKINNNAVTVTVNSSNNTFSFDVRTALGTTGVAKGTYQVTYDTKVTAQQLQQMTEDKTTEQNTVSWKVNGEKDVPGGNTSIEIDKPQTPIPVVKEIVNGTEARQPGDEIEYRITYGDENTELAGFTIADSLTDVQALQGAISIQYSGTTTTMPEASIDKSATDTIYSKNMVTLFQYTFPNDTVGNGPVTVTYKTKLIDSETAKKNGIFDTTYVNNTAEEKRQNTSSTVTTVVNYEKEPTYKINKTASKPSNGESWQPGEEITYTLTIGDENTDMAGVEIRDVMNDLQVLQGDIMIQVGTNNSQKLSEYVPGAITYAADENYSGNDVELFKFNMPNTAGKGPVVITYKAKVISQYQAESAGIYGGVQLRNTGYGGKQSSVTQGEGKFEDYPITKSVTQNQTDINHATVEIGSTVHYILTFGKTGMNMENVTILDEFTDIQKLVGDITIKKADGTTYKMPNGSGMWNDDGVVWMFSDDEKYSSSNVRVFNYRLPEDIGNGPIIVEYDAQIITEAEAKESGITGDQTAYNTFRINNHQAQTEVKIEFPREVKHNATVRKEFDHWDVENSRVYWNIIVEKDEESAYPLTDVSVREAWDVSHVSITEGNQGYHGYNRFDGTYFDAIGAVITTDDGTVLTPGKDYTIDKKNTMFTFPVLNERVHINLGFISPAKIIDGYYMKNEVYLNNGTIGEADQKYTKPDIEAVKNGKYNESDRVITWEVQINPSSKQLEESEPSSLIFSDTIPEGLTIIGYNGEDTPSIHVSFGNSQYMVGTSIKDVGTYTNYANDILKIQDNPAGGTIISANIIPYQKDWQGISNISGRLSGNKVVVTYKTKLSDEEWNSITSSASGEKDFTNHATITAGDNETFEATDTVTVTSEGFITKTDSTREKGGIVVGEDDTNSKEITYTIEINPNAYVLNSGNNLTLTDLIDTNMDIDPDSVKLIDKDGSKANGIIVSYNDDSRLLSISGIPDQTHYTLTYTCIARAQGQDTFENTATLIGGGSHSDSTSEKHTISTEEAGVMVDGLMLNLHKIDENGLEKDLAGAQFQLYECELAIGDLTNKLKYPSTFWNAFLDHTDDPQYNVEENYKIINYKPIDEVKTTGINGMTDWERLSENKLYAWKEIKAPDGYVCNSDYHYFVLYQYIDVNTEDPSKTKRLPDNEQINRRNAAWALDDACQAANGIRVASLANLSTWTATNVEEKFTSITATKNWEGDNKNLYETRPTNGIKLQLWKINADGTKTAEGNPVAINAGNDGNWPSYIWNRLLAFDSDGKVIKYTVTEERVDNYTTTYSDNGLGQTSGTITITNKMIPKSTDIYVKKVFEPAGIEKPSQILVDLMVIRTDREGNFLPIDETGTQGMLSEGNNWTYHFEKLPTKEVINGVPYTLTYTVKEAASIASQYDLVTYSDHNEGVIEATADDPIVISNKLVTTGDLLLKKRLASGTSDQDFVFVVRFTGDKVNELENEYTILISDGSDQNPETSSVLIANNTAKITIKAGQEITIKDLPLGINYEVTEENASGFKVSSSRGITGQIRKNTVPEAEIVNEQISDVKVTKAFSGIDKLPEGFQITNDYNSTVFTANNASGTNPYEWTIRNVPVGTKITFTESGMLADGYTLTANGTAITDANATVSATATSEAETINTATFNNVYKRYSGTLKIRKDVTGEKAKISGFQFTVQDAGHNYYDINGNSKGSTETKIPVSDGATVEILNLPMGTYTVTELGTDQYESETGAKVLGYTLVAAEPQTGKLENNGQVVEVTLTNRYTAKEGTAQIEGTKEYDRAFNANEFTFEMIEVNEKGEPVAGSSVETATLESAVNSAEGTSGKYIGTFQFRQKTYKKIGTYYYKVTERKGDKSYVNYATNSYIVSVKVEDEGRDSTTLKTTVTTNPGGGIRFNNTYRSTGSVTLEAQKTLKGGKLNANDFKFLLQDSSRNNIQINKGNDASGKVVFETIEYTQNDVSKSPFKYYIREVIPDDAKNSEGQNYKGALDKTGPFSKDGITYDGREIEVTVNLEDDGQGKITAIPSYGSETTGYTHANEFINKYTATGSLQLEAWKTLNGEAPTGKTFTFKITRVSQNGSAITGNDSYSEEKTSANDGKVEFPVINFTREAVFGANSAETEKTIYYLIEEVSNPNDHTINYDTHKELVTVLLQDDGKGHIIATPDKNGTSIQFNNTSVKNASATLQVNKTLTGRELKNDEFSFDLTAKTEGDPNASGNQTKIIDTKANSGGVVIFKDLTYSAETLGNSNSKEFTYEITEVIPEDAQNASGVAYAKADNKTGPFIKNGISYDGKTITATVTVTKDGDKLKTSVSYTDNDSKSNNEKIFENTYDASGSAVIEATKALEGKELEAKKYSFTLTGDKINETKQNGAVENSAVGSITFEPIQYTLADLAGAKSRTFNYTIEEVLTNKISGVVYDEHQENVTVTVTDTGNGTLKTTVHYDTDGATFTNRYQTTPVDVQVAGRKILNGDTLKANQFSFSLTRVSAKESAEAGAKDILDQNANQTKYNEANGNITFDRLHYEKPGVYTYQIQETSASGNGIAVDGTVYTLTVTVTDNDNGQLEATRKLTYVNKEKQTVEVTGAVASFTNTYSAKGEAMIEAKKELEGKTLKKDQFTFTLTPVSALGTDGTTEITDPNSTQTAKNDASGKVAFAKLNYTVPGTYTYKVQESGEDGKGIRIDRTVYQVSVRVSDLLQNGTLGTEVTYKNLTTNQNVAAPIVFKNVYTAESVEGELSAEKKLVDAEGKALNLGNRKFLFAMTLTEAKQDNTDLTNDAPSSRTAENSANGSVKFSKLTFTKPGVYVYTVSETTESGNGVIKDSSVYTVTYTVTDDGEGHLKLTREIKKGTETASDIVFMNRYRTNAATVDVTARKEITGRALKAQEFTFSLTKLSAVGADGSTAIADANENQTLVLNELDGSINFASLTYTNAGTYTYRMNEVTTSSDDVVTDSTEYTVIVTVTDDGNGQLDAKRVYKRGDATVADAEVKFVNQYLSGNLELTKEVTGNTVGDTEKQKEFTFTITLKDAAEKNISDTYSAIRTAENGAETETSVEFNNGNASVKLKHGEKLLIRGLPHKAAYTVSEMNAEGYVLQKISGQSGTIEKDQTKQVKAVNIHDTFGSLQLKKVLTGNDVYPEQEFKVRVTVYEPDGITVDKTVNGNKYGAAEFQEGISKPISIKSTGTKLISNLPNGAKYKVEELDSATKNALSVNQTDSTHHYILKSIVYTPNAEGVISSSTQQIATLTNERNSFGGLSVQKHVAGNASTQISNFEFTVTLGTDQNGNRINGNYGDMTFNDGVATFSLANGDVKTARGLPNGIPYEVVEKDYSRDGYETIYTHEKGLIIGDVAYSTVEAAQAAEASINEKNKVEVTNTRNADGTLSVTKKVEGNLGDRNKTFTIQITLGGTEKLDHVECSSNGGTMTLDQTTRTLTATLKAGQTASATGIPNGTPFTVSESGAEDYQITYQINGKTGTTGTIDEKNENKVTVTNTKNGYGGLKIIKKTAGNDPNKKSWFAFKVTLSEPLTGIFGSVRFENGVSAGPADTQGDVDYTNGKVPAGFFKVKVTEAIEGEEGKTGAVAITGLPAGITYTVEEADYSETYDTAVFTNASGTISSLADAPEKVSANQITDENVVTCVNTRNRWGKLVIRKKVQGQPVDPNKQYSFTIEIKDKNGQGLSGTYAGVEFTDGKGKVSLVAGEEKVITDLPLLSTFTVNEENASIDGYVWSEKHDLTYREKNAEGTKVEKTETNTNTGTIMVDQRIVTFTNTYEKPAIEKYVNKMVHDDLPAFDTTFVYDIISYIPIDADSAEIYDTLDDNIQDRDNKNALVFISKEDEVNVVDLGLTVDHTVHGSVESSGTAIAESAGVEKIIDIDRKTLTVKIKDATSLRGHWVKVMYTARIDQDKITSLADYEKATLTIKENTPVLGGETRHTGIANTASYKVWVNHQGGSGSGSGGEGGSEGGGNTPGSDKPKYEEESNTVTVTPPTTKVSFTKKWTDEMNAEKAWPEGVTVTVKLTKAKAGEEQAEVSGYEPVVLDGVTTEGSFENIPVYEGVTYSVAEAVNGMDPRLFTMTLSAPDNTVAGEQRFTITNQILETSASVMKVWADEENQDGIRPLSLTVTLAADGVATDTKKTLNEQNHWTATVEHLPLMNTEGTAKIKYSWLEAETAGYTLTGMQELVAKDGTMSILINTHVPGTMEIPVRKVWDDNDNARNTRPASVKVQLFANGIARGETLTLNAENGWRGSWTGLPGTENGKAIQYTVEEIGVPEGYSASVSGNAGSGFTVTNSLERGKIVIAKTFEIEIPEEETEVEDEYREVTVRKVWVDNDDRDGNRPGSVTVHLYAGGTEVASAQITAAEGWEHTFYGLPATVDGRRIHYSVTEDPVAWYVGTVNGFTVTNTYQPETTRAAVTKIWNDNLNEQGVRPAQVRVTLSNGQGVVTQAVLSEENGWTATVGNLPTRVNGAETVYTWSEEPVIGYVLEDIRVSGQMTEIVNKPWDRENIPENQKPKRVPGNTFYIFEDYDTPLGVEVLINHVGDCFD